MESTRRDFLRMAATLSASAGITGFVPEAIRRAVSITPDPGSTYKDADHVVILMQENRSFDHTFGTLQGVRGFNDPRALRLANGNSVFVQTDAAGSSYAPWRLDIRDTRITWMGSIPHTRHSQVDAWNGGRQNGWIDAKRSSNREFAPIPMTMGHYTREDLPFYYALADSFTVCDQNYSSIMSSTSPNRCVFWTGTIRDRQANNSRVFMRNDEILMGGMTWKTFPERLADAGVSWKFYQNELTNSAGLTDEEDAWLSNFGCNILEYFAIYNVQAYAGGEAGLKDEMDSQTQRVDKARRALSGSASAATARQLRARIAIGEARIRQIEDILASSSQEHYRRLTAAQRALHDSAFTTNAGDRGYRSLEPLTFSDNGKAQKTVVPKGDILYQFRKDVEDGRLPAVSWLSAPERFSDHPMSPWYGAWYVSEIVDILTKNPEVWKKTIFILTYDENDGYFDHAPSYVAADPKRPETGGASAGIDLSLEYTYAEDELDQGTAESDARTGPIGMGFRVPMIVASPWSRGGWVNSQLFDHASTLMFLEDFVQQRFGKRVREENISAWRRAISGNLTSCFRPYDGNEPALDYLDRDKHVVQIQRAKNKKVPTDYRALTSAEIAAINARDPQAPTARQEPGIRPACALPYELSAHGHLTADRAAFQLELTAANHLHGERSAGAPFNVYLRNLRSRPSEMQPATYSVSAGDTLRPSFPLAIFADGKYLVEVHAPNGFYRSFAGDAQSSLETELAWKPGDSESAGSLRVTLRNPGQSTLSVSLIDHSYGTAAVQRAVAPESSETVTVPLAKSHGWYDFSVRAEGSDAESHFAGRIETGGASYTDPAMGNLS